MRQRGHMWRVFLGLVVSLVLVGWGGVSDESQAQWGECVYCVAPSPGAIPSEADERAHMGSAGMDWLSEQVARDRARAARERAYWAEERRHREQMEALRYPNGRIPQPCSRTREVAPGIWGSEMGVEDRNGVCRF